MLARLHAVPVVSEICGDDHMKNELYYGLCNSFFFLSPVINLELSRVRGRAILVWSLDQSEWQDAEIITKNVLAT